MTLLGHIENGVIVLDEAMTLPDGMKVRVEVVPLSKAQVEDIEKPRTHYDHYESIIGAAEGLPADFAAEHDHYIHGTPKRGMSQPQESSDASPTLYEQLQPIAGTLKGLPPDLARNHDHYIHGQAKK
jgi:hypothetical protein